MLLCTDFTTFRCHCHPAYSFLIFLLPVLCFQFPLVMYFVLVNFFTLILCVSPAWCVWHLYPYKKLYSTGLDFIRHTASFPDFIEAMPFPPDTGEGEHHRFSGPWVKKLVLWTRIYLTTSATFAENCSSRNFTGLKFHTVKMLKIHWQPEQQTLMGKFTAFPSPRSWF